MNTKITAIAALVLATASASSAFASEAFDVDIYRPAVSQTQASQAYAQVPTTRQAVQQNVNASENKSYTDRASQID